MADATYIEPIHWEAVRKIIEKKASGCGAADHGRPDGAELRAGAERQGVLEEPGVTMIAAPPTPLIKPKTASISR